MLFLHTNFNKRMSFFSRSVIFQLFLAITVFTGILFAQNHPDNIVGYYLNEDPFSGTLSQIYIYNAGNGTYEGIVIWTKEESRKQFEGLVFLKGMTFNAKENEWENAAIIYPGKKGKFKAFMRLEKDGQLRVRGYWGVSMFGKTLYWPREEESRNPKIEHP